MSGAIASAARARPRPPGAPSRRAIALVWAVTLVLSGALMVSVLPRAVRARRAGSVQLAAARTLARSASELARLRAESPIGRAPPPGGPTLTARVSAALAAAGLPVSALDSLSPESQNIERATDAADLVRRRATMVLTPVTLPRLGRFLAEWHDGSPEWTPTRIDLEPIIADAGPSRRAPAPSPGSGPGSANPGADLPLRVTVAVESVSLQHRPERPEP